MDLDELCINTIRCLSIDGVEAAGCGHPGMPMGMAPAAYVLWTKIMKHNPDNPKWVNRDRFILSAGHGSMLLYSLLHLSGYKLSLEELKNFRQLDSLTPGHPEYGETPGVELTTGPLGQGLASAVGMAIAQKHGAAYFNRPKQEIIDYHIYVIAGDGCLQEGISSEASSLAGHLGLNNLVVIYDDNQITIDGKTELSFTENVKQRYESYGWKVFQIDGDGNDIQQIESVLTQGKSEKRLPVLIQLKTKIGFGSPNKQGTAGAHGAALGKDEIDLTKKAYHWSSDQTFFIPEAVAEVFLNAKQKGAQWEADWLNTFETYKSGFPQEAKTFETAIAGKYSENFEQIFPYFEQGQKMATRQASGKILQDIMPKLPLVMAGSADLTPSNNTWFEGAKDFQKESPDGRYIRYGVREHAMGAIQNGIALSGYLRTYAATFLCFSDYMRPAIRLAALSNYPSIFVFTHDSIGLGEDGPTHQPVEHLAALRAIPNLTVIRPADANETVEAWKVALKNKGPTALILTRQAIPVLQAHAKETQNGAYRLQKQENVDLLLLSSGSEVHLCVDATAILLKEGIQAQVVSMPSWELFEKQSTEYQQQVLPPTVKKRIAVEAAVGLGWEKYIGFEGQFIGMHGFGASAPAKDLFRKFGIAVDAIVAEAKKMIAYN